MFIQQATGKVSLAVEGEYHCGPNHDSPKTFQYEVEVHYPDEALSSQGMLLDNLFFHHYWMSLSPVRDSCELMTRKAAQFFWDSAVVCGGCLYVRVCIWGFHENDMEAQIEYVLKGAEA